jgi:hypothetical protein
VLASVALFLSVLRGIFGTTPPGPGVIICPVVIYLAIFRLSTAGGKRSISGTAFLISYVWVLFLISFSDSRVPTSSTLTSATFNLTNLESTVAR